jgi:hypothetical protein
LPGVASIVLENLKGHRRAFPNHANELPASLKEETTSRNHATEDGSKSEYPGNSTVIEKALPNRKARIFRKSAACHES